MEEVRFSHDEVRQLNRAKTNNFNIKAQDMDKERDRLTEMPYTDVDFILSQTATVMSPRPRQSQMTILP